jgi:hypothetical protein
LGGIALNGRSARAQSRIHAGASRRRLDGVLHSELRPEQKADLNDAEDEGDEDRQSERELDGRRAALIPQ